MKLYVVYDYPNQGDETTLCDDCFDDLSCQQKEELDPHVLKDMDAVNPGEECGGPCKRLLEDLID